MVDKRQKSKVNLESDKFESDEFVDTNFWELNYTSTIELLTNLSNCCQL